VDAAIKVASRVRPGQRVATFLCETGKRYQV
jgi:cysteine synthase